MPAGAPLRPPRSTLPLAPDRIGADDLRLADLPDHRRHRREHQLVELEERGPAAGDRHAGRRDGRDRRGASCSTWWTGKTSTTTPIPHMADWTYYNAHVFEREVPEPLGNASLPESEGHLRRASCSASWGGCRHGWVESGSTRRAKTNGWRRSRRCSTTRETPRTSQFDPGEPDQRARLGRLSKGLRSVRSSTRGCSRSSRSKLDAMGTQRLRFIGPEHRAQASDGVDGYLPQLFANSVVMGKLDHFGSHNYSGQTGGADAADQGIEPSRQELLDDRAIRS